MSNEAGLDEIQSQPDLTVPATDNAGGGGVVYGSPDKVPGDWLDAALGALPRSFTKRLPTQSYDSPPREDEPWKFGECKSIVFKGGPLDGLVYSAATTDADGLIYFFRNSGTGRIEQAVYRVTLEEISRTDEERRAGKIQEFNWIGEYVGKRYMPVPMVNGIRKGS